MNLLVAIPTIGPADMTKRAIDSVVGEADVLVIDNNSDDLTKLMLCRDDIFTIVNDVNEYVNKSWNDAIEVFLDSSHDTLIIMNSDLVMQPGWSKRLDPTKICIPTDGSHTYDVLVTEGTPGVFIHLSRQMAEIVYPIPTYCKLWWGDYFIFSVLRGLGYQTVVKAGLIAEHINGGSQSVNVVPNKVAIIEQDKVEWAKYGEQDIKERIELWKSVLK